MTMTRKYGHKIYGNTFDRTLKVRVPEATFLRLKWLAGEYNLSISDIIRHVLEQLMDRTNNGK